MFQSIVSFLFGVYIGQEFGNNIPNVKNKTIEILKEFEKTEFYSNYIKRDKNK
jgi:hypothetical protein